MCHSTNDVIVIFLTRGENVLVTGQEHVITCNYHVHTYNFSVHSMYSKKKNTTHTHLILWKDIVFTKTSVSILTLIIPAAQVVVTVT